MPKIKVLHVIEQLKTTGGAEKRLLNDLKYLDGKKIENIVYCLGAYNNQLVKNLRKKFKINTSSEKTTFRFIELIKIIKKIKPDIVHTQLFYSDILGRTAAKLCRVPVIISTFQSSVHEPNVPYYYVKRRRLLDMITARFCTRFIAVSEFVKKSVSKRLFINPEKISVIYNYVEFPKIKEQNKRNEKIILCCVGKINPAKGQFDLIKAVKQFVVEGGNLKLVLAGEGPCRKKCEKYVLEHEIADKITFLGNTNNIQELLSKSDAFVFPTYSEGLSLALLEAVFAKKPCIISNIPPNLEVIKEENCFVFKPKDSESIISSIKQFLATNPKELKNMAKQAYKEAKEKFDPKKQTEQLQKLYLELYKKIK